MSISWPSTSIRFHSRRAISHVVSYEAEKKTILVFHFGRGHFLARDTKDPTRRRQLSGRVKNLSTLEADARKVVAF